MLEALALALRVLRAEGGGAVRDRMLDRLAAWRRRRAYRIVERVGVESLALATRRAESRVAVLNVLPTAPRPDQGGVQLQLLRRLEAEAERRPWALLYPESGERRAGYRLEIGAGRRCEAVAYRVPVTLAEDRLSDATFTRVVRHAAQRIGARGVHFEQLVGLPLATAAELRADGLRVVVSVHDFGLFCLRPHLLEHPGLRFCDYCREPQRCAACLAQSWRVEYGFQERRRALASEVLRAADAVIFPSDFLRRTYLELLPGAAAGDVRVIEPPSVATATLTPLPRPRSRVRHLAYVGSVLPHKGALILEQLIRRLAGRRDLRFSVYGGGDREIMLRLRRLPGVRVRGYYRAGDLPRRLRKDGVDLALLLSIVPESYGLTLDESLLARVPVLAFDHGALGERLRKLGAGMLVDPAGGLEAVLAAVTKLLDVGWQPPAGGSAFAPPTARDAAGACLEIYRELGLEAEATGHESSARIPS